jgi:hypothetical protein
MRLELDWEAARISPQVWNWFHGLFVVSTPTTSPVSRAWDRISFYFLHLPVFESKSNLIAARHDLDDGRLCHT